MIKTLLITFDILGFTADWIFVAELPSCVNRLSFGHYFNLPLTYYHCVVFIYSLFLCHSKQVVHFTYYALIRIVDLCVWPLLSGGVLDSWPGRPGFESQLIPSLPSDHLGLNVISIYTELAHKCSRSTQSSHPFVDRQTWWAAHALRRLSDWWHFHRITCSEPGNMQRKLVSGRVLLKWEINCSLIGIEPNDGFCCFCQRYLSHTLHEIALLRYWWLFQIW